MSAFTVAAGLLGAAMLPAGIACFRGGALERLAALEMAGVVVTLALVTMAVAVGRPGFIDLALAAALLSFGGGLVFARFLERWL